ncbi:MAG TPA: hypothetical protein VGN97_02025 [Mesorhizobium sp.]|jgi:hypothetical protein|nr:hypothetical protein [Mesorhizobium sp.]
MISTFLHGVIDYLVGAALVAAPFLFGFADGGAAQWATTAMGVVAFIYSLLTDYELGALRLLPMRVHLGIDLAFAPLLMALPWLFGFADQVWLPHLILGAGGVVVTALTWAGLRRA